MIAALFVQRDGCYSGIDGVDCWDEKRDARLYRGPHPVVAHPPCARWCQLASLVEARYGYKKGEDGGCFLSALRSVCDYGGVLEHPAYSAAWAAHGLPAPPGCGGWVRGLCGGWSCHVEQLSYGHAARKKTWLYCFGVAPPPMRWGSPRGVEPTAVISDLCPGPHRRLRGKEASATPIEFRDALIAIARSAR